MKKLVCIVGSTGSGKTAVGIDVALALGAEILSIDSRQLYRDFIIGTAQPTAAEQAQVPHHLTNFHDAREPMTAGTFAKLARDKIKELLQSGKPTVLVGGSGLYYRAIFDGLFQGPPIDPEYREKLRDRAEQSGVPALHLELQQVDPVIAEKIQPNDYIRIERALEVFHTSGKRLSDWWQNGTDRFEFEPIYVCLRRERSDVVRRIAQRTAIMLREGWIDEVRQLLEAGYGDAIEREKFHGYREIAAYLRNELSLAETEERINIVTRQYAKRQMTWFRHTEGMHWVDVTPDDSTNKIAQRVLQIVQPILSAKSLTS